MFYAKKIAQGKGVVIPEWAGQIAKNGGSELRKRIIFSLGVN